MDRIERIVALPLEQFPPELIAEVEAAGLDPARLHRDVTWALEEDLPGPDVTSWSTISAGDSATADFIARGEGTVAGLMVAEWVLRYVLGASVEVARLLCDGDRVQRGAMLMTAVGPTALLLTAERTALNYLCHLSGVATATTAWVDALAGTTARVRDTRKTIPHLRELDKYAVRCGGGVNHRHNLTDQALIKDNHVLAAGGVVEAYELVQSFHRGIETQVEVTSLEQLDKLLDRGVSSILLDNMSVADMEVAVERAAGRCRLEASGGLTLARAAEVAATGVDFIAVGALTHSAAVLDIAMDLRSKQV